jgi:hypothetical protein
MKRKEKKNREYPIKILCDFNKRVLKLIKGLDLEYELWKIKAESNQSHHDPQ